MTKTFKNLCIVSDEFKVDDATTIKANEANTCEDNRVLFCTTLASISRGKALSANPSVRFDHLKKEAAPSYYDYIKNGDKASKTPSRPLEFVPVVVKGYCKGRYGNVNICLELKSTEGYKVDYEFDLASFNNKIGRFSYVVKDLKGKYDIIVYTNLRCLLNAGINYYHVPFNTKEELSAFKAVRVRAPMFVFNHLVTHTALSKEARSERVVNMLDLDAGTIFGYEAPFDQPFWYPESITPDEFNMMVHGMSMSDVFEYLKNKKFPKEIYQRAILEWRYKDFVLVAWDNEYTWRHLFLERGAEDYNNWTQQETKDVVGCIKDVISGVAPLSN